MILVSPWEAFGVGWGGGCAETFLRTPGVYRVMFAGIPGLQIYTCKSFLYTLVVIVRRLNIGNPPAHCNTVILSMLLHLRRHPGLGMQSYFEAPLIARAVNRVCFTDILKPRFSAQTMFPMYRRRIRRACGCAPCSKSLFLR